MNVAPNDKKQLPGGADSITSMDPEKSTTALYEVGDFVDDADAGIGEVDEVDPDTGTHRKLQTRHISLMSLAGVIGAGLIVGFGQALHLGGPAACLIGFTSVGIIAWSVTQSAGELATIYPAGGAFLSLSSRFVNGPFGFVVGWNYFIVWVTVAANEYNTLSSILYTWSDRVPIYGYFLIFWAAFTAFQFIGVHAFGEAEFVLGWVKLIGITAFFLFSLVYACGGIHNHPALGFHYWNDPGAWADGFRGVAKVFVYASTYYVGTEMIAVTASEAKNPRTAIPKAANQVAFRIAYVYIGMSIFIGMVCPWNAEQLSSSTKALASPMSIAIQNAGWHAGWNLINAFLLVILLSAINSSVYTGSRTVMYLASHGAAPSFMRWTNSRGVPVWAMLFTHVFSFISLMNVSQGANASFGYITNISGVSTFVVWAGISLTHLRFRRAWRVQGHKAADLPWRAVLYPLNPLFGVVINVFLLLVQGWTSLSPFSAKDFVDAYIMIPASLAGYFGTALYSAWRSTDKNDRFMKRLYHQLTWHSPDNIDLSGGKRYDIDTYAKPRWWQLI